MTTEKIRLKACNRPSFVYLANHEEIVFFKRIHSKIIVVFCTYRFSTPSPPPTQALNACSNQETLGWGCLFSLASSAVLCNFENFLPSEYPFIFL